MTTTCSWFVNKCGTRLAKTFCYGLLRQLGANLQRSCSVQLVRFSVCIRSVIMHSSFVQLSGYLRIMSQERVRVILTRHAPTTGSPMFRPLYRKPQINALYRRATSVGTFEVSVLAHIALRNLLWLVNASCLYWPMNTLIRSMIVAR